MCIEARTGRAAQFFESGVEIFGRSFDRSYDRASKLPFVVVAVVYFPELELVKMFQSFLLGHNFAKKNVRHKRLAFRPVRQNKLLLKIKISSSDSKN